jgi:hypothetical protein
VPSGAPPPGNTSARSRIALFSPHPWALLAELVRVNESFMGLKGRASKERY